jgi:hypothetical protein
MGQCGGVGGGDAAEGVSALGWRRSVVIVLGCHQAARMSTPEIAGGALGGRGLARPCQFLWNEEPKPSSGFGSSSCETRVW